MSRVPNTTKTSRGKKPQTQDQTEENNHVFSLFENMTHSQQSPYAQHPTSAYPPFIPPHYNSSFSSPNHSQYTQHPNFHPNYYPSSHPHNTDYPNIHQNNPYSSSNSQYPPSQEFPDVQPEEFPDVPPLRNVRVEKTRASITYFTPQMDILLATTFAQATDNAIAGADQKGAIFWGEIADRYNEGARQMKVETRPTSSLLNRFGKMRLEMVLHREALEFVNRNCASGWNEVDKMIAVGNRFRQMNPANVKNKDFKFEHVRKILESCSKFSFSTTNGDDMYQDSEEEGNPDTPHTNTSQVGSNPLSSERTSGSKRGSDEISSPVRPKGNKASKAEGNGRKMKGKKLESDFEDSYRQAQNEKHDERAEKFVGALHSKAEKRNKILQDLVDVQKQKIKQRNNDRIMNFNLDDCKSEEEREFMMQKRFEIMQGWANTSD